MSQGQAGIEFNWPFDWLHRLTVQVRHRVVPCQGQVNYRGIERVDLHGRAWLSAMDSWFRPMQTEIPAIHVVSNSK